jgi:hypothetical protein
MQTLISRDRYHWYLAVIFNPRGILKSPPVEPELALDPALTEQTIKPLTNGVGGRDGKVDDDDLDELNSKDGEAEGNEPMDVDGDDHVGNTTTASDRDELGLEGDKPWDHNLQYTMRGVRDIHLDSRPDDRNSSPGAPIESMTLEAYEKQGREVKEVEQPKKEEEVIPPVVPKKKPLEDHRILDSEE